MNILDKTKYTALVNKYGMRYSLARDSIITSELEEVKTKYSMSDDDYIKLNVGIEILTIKELKKRDKVNIPISNNIPKIE